MEHNKLLSWEHEWINGWMNEWPLSVFSQRWTFNAFWRLFLFFFQTEELMEPYLQYEPARLNALHNTVISESFPTKRARLLNIKERQRTKLFLKLSIKLLHSRPSLKGMSVLLPLREVIILFLSETNKWSLTMGHFLELNLSVGRIRGFNFLAAVYLLSCFSPHWSFLVFLRGGGFPH